MLTVNRCAEIAQNACINLFGKQFIDAHREDFCSTRYFNNDTGLFEYSLLYAPIEEDTDDHSLVTGNSPFDYYASVLVNVQTGEVIINPDESKTKLPRI